MSNTWAEGVAWSEGVAGFLLTTALRASLFALVAFSLAFLVRRQAAALRRRLWGAAVVGFLLLPALGLLPDWEIALLPIARTTEPILAAPNSAARRPHGDEPTGPGGEPSIGTPAAPAMDVDRGARPGFEKDKMQLGAQAPGSPIAFWALGLVLLYGGGLILSLGRLLAARRRARNLLAHARALPPGVWPVPDGLRALSSETVVLPLTIGALRPVILLPAGGRDWPRDWRKAVVDHEVAHVRCRDPLLQLLSELARAIHWYNPFVHLAGRQLRTERELAADDAALGGGARPTRYAEVLYELACIPGETAQAGAVVPLLTPAGLKARVLGILDSSRPRQASPLASTVLSALGALLFLSTANGALVRGTDADAPGMLIGRLVDTVGRPVVGAEITFRTENAGAESTLRTEGDPKRHFIRKTTSGGWFHAPAGAKLGQSYWVYGRHGTEAVRKTILDVPYGTELPVTLTLRKAFTVGGTIRDEETGRPIAGAKVRILQDWLHAIGPGPLVQVQSDAEGRWRFEGLLYGEYLFLIETPWGVFSTVKAHLENDNATGLDLEIGREPPITGYLVDTTGAPLPGIRVDREDLRLYRHRPDGPELVRRLAGTRYLDWDESAADGSFSIVVRGRPHPIRAEMPDGRVLFGELFDRRDRVMAIRSQADTALPGDRGRPRPSRIVLRPGGTVAGQVRRQGDGRPVPGVTVHASPRNLPFLITKDMRPVVTDENGRYVLGPLPPGKTAILFRWTDPGTSRPARDTLWQDIPSGGVLEQVDLTIELPD